MFRSHLPILDLQAASWEHFLIGNCDAVLLGKLLDLGSTNLSTSREVWRGLFSKETAVMRRWRGVGY